MNDFRFKQFLTASLALLVFFGNATSAQAVTFTLNNVKFSDGGTASGSFDYNGLLGGYSNINITVNGGNTVNLPTTNYLSSNSIVTGSSIKLTITKNTSFNTRELSFNFVNILPNLGQTFTILTTSSECKVSLPITCRTIVSGSVSSPPAAVPFEFSPALGLSILGGMFGVNQVKKKINSSRFHR